MLFIVDKRIPEEAKKKLSEFGEVLEFLTDGITDEYLAGHPDIFFTKINNKIIYAPNTPSHYLKKIEIRIEIISGEEFICKGYPGCARYNAVISGNNVIHNKKITDNIILKETENFNFINVKQGFTRCSLVPTYNSFLTSDPSIEKELKCKNLNVIFCKPYDILLPGVKHGLLGGACGFSDDILFIIGSLKYFNDGEKIIKDSLKNNYRIVELYDGPLFDGGSIIILK